MKAVLGLLLALVLAVGCGTPGTLLWKYQPNAKAIEGFHWWSAVTRPVIGPDGSVYIGAEQMIRPKGTKGEKSYSYWIVYVFDGKTGAIKRQIDVDGSSFHIHSDGRIYIASHDGLKTYVMDGRTGAKGWSIKWPEIEGGINGLENTISELVRDNNEGVIYALAHGHDGQFLSRIYSFDVETKQFKWEIQKGGKGERNWLRLIRSGTGFGIRANGAICATSDDTGEVYAFDTKTGVEQWVFKTGRSTSRKIGTDGTVYVGADKKVHALDGKTGAKKWEFEIEEKVGNFLAIGRDGTVYFGSSDKIIYALDGKSGTKKWGFETESLGRPTPAIGPDGTVYVGSNGNKAKKIYALDGKAGTKKWEFETGGWVRTSPTIGPDGTVYVGTDGKIYALDNKTGAKKWEFEIEGGLVGRQLVIGSDGILYAGTSAVYAIAIGSKEPMEESTTPQNAR